MMSTRKTSSPAYLDNGYLRAASSFEWEWSVPTIQSEEVVEEKAPLSDTSPSSVAEPTSETAPSTWPYSPRIHRRAAANSSTTPSTTPSLTKYLSLAFVMFVWEIVVIAAVVLLVFGLFWFIPESKTAELPPKGIDWMSSWYNPSTPDFTSHLHPFTLAQRFLREHHELLHRSETSSKSKSQSRATDEPPFVFGTSCEMSEDGTLSCTVCLPDRAYCITERCRYHDDIDEDSHGADDLDSNQESHVRKGSAGSTHMTCDSCATSHGREACFSLSCDVGAISQTAASLASSSPLGTHVKSLDPELLLQKSCKCISDDQTSCPLDEVEKTDFASASPLSRMLWPSSLEDEHQASIAGLHGQLALLFVLMGIFLSLGATLQLRQYSQKSFPPSRSSLSKRKTHCSGDDLASLWSEKHPTKSIIQEQ